MAAVSRRIFVQSGLLKFALTSSSCLGQWKKLRRSLNINVTHVDEYTPPTKYTYYRSWQKKEKKYNSCLYPHMQLERIAVQKSWCIIYS